jgi:2-dehydro-3-deoxygalactonokinase
MTDRLAGDPAVPPPLVCVDAGTTNTRVWLVAGGRILARREATIGARDTARDGHSRALRGTLRDLIANVRARTPLGMRAPWRVAAAGMITSRQGLYEVPHVAAPAGAAELAAGAREAVLSDITDVPILFVPGVRTGSLDGGEAGIGSVDVMRGEETLAVGLFHQGRIPAGSLLLHVGSHWKVIRIDAAGRVAGSVTSLAGEMLQAVTDQTILASGLPSTPLVALDEDLLRQGMDEARRSGLARALFCVRLLELAGGSSAEGRLSFLVGAFIGAELAGLEAGGALVPGMTVTIAGDDKVGGAWHLALARAGWNAHSLTPAEREAGFLAGLAAVVEARAHLEEPPLG